MVRTLAVILSYLEKSLQRFEASARGSYLRPLAWGFERHAVLKSGLSPLHICLIRFGKGLQSKVS